jgi:hypothetical protein
MALTHDVRQWYGMSGARRGARHGRSAAHERAVPWSNLIVLATSGRASVGVGLERALLYPGRRLTGFEIFHSRKEAADMTALNAHAPTTQRALLGA